MTCLGPGPAQAMAAGREMEGGEEREERQKKGQG